jgi:acetyl-CoA synthetase
MIRTVYGDNQRYYDTYWEMFDGKLYVAGDNARRDKDGYFWIMGRIDDVLNVSGHRLGTMEVESALVAHPKVAEAAVVGYPHDIKGEGIFAFVVLRGERPADGIDEELTRELREWVTKQIGPIAKPDEIRYSDNLPKTRSGKIMRRLLRNIARGVPYTHLYQSVFPTFSIIYLAQYLPYKLKIYGYSPNITLDNPAYHVVGCF